MSHDCITLSSDSSLPSSPRSNGYSEDIEAARCEYLEPSAFERKADFFSLSDSDSEVNPRCFASHDSAKSLTLGSDDSSEAPKKRKKAIKITSEERAKRKAVQLAEKEAIQARKKYQRSLLPGECLKYVTAEIDEEIFKFKCLPNLKESLTAKEQKFRVTSHIKGSVAWTRELPGDDVQKDEERIILCLTAEEMTRMAVDGILASHVESMKDLLPNKFITLVVCGVEDFFKPSKSKNRSKVKTNTASKLPRDCRRTLEESLVHVQLLHGVGHRMVENSSELASLIAMFTKAVAETPFKRDKQERERSGVLNWFAQGDSKDCIKVDSVGNGCLLLWRQQLRQFNNVGLDIAEAIASSYPSPKALVKAYKSCGTVAEAQKLLQNIPVRRGCGPLSSVRKVGPELSRKIHTFFTSSNGNQFLSEN